MAEAFCCNAPGINTGVMLFRNTAWSRSLLDELYGYAQLGDEALQEMKAVRVLLSRAAVLLQLRLHI